MWFIGRGFCPVSMFHFITYFVAASFLFFTLCVDVTIVVTKENTETVREREKKKNVCYHFFLVFVRRRSVKQLEKLCTAIA